jgi:hypothetical protein
MRRIDDRKVACAQEKLGLLNFAMDNIIPLGVRCGAHWEDYPELIHIRLAASFVENAARDFIYEDNIKTVPQFKFSDPLLAGLAIGLAGELEADALPGSLYAETLANTAVHLLRRYSTARQGVQEVIKEWHPVWCRP